MTSGLSNSFIAPMGPPISPTSGHRNEALGAQKDQLDSCPGRHDLVARSGKWRGCTFSATGTDPARKRPRGPIDATIDGVSCRTIATYAMSTRPVLEGGDFSVPLYT
jgi:hypothetical protein